MGRSTRSIIFLKKDDRAVRRDWIISYNLQTKSENVFRDIPGGTLYHPCFSWDDRWVLFKEPIVATSRSKIMIAPVRHGRTGSEQQWVTVTDGRCANDKPQFAPDATSRVASRFVACAAGRTGCSCSSAANLAVPRGTP
jgi:hypothetical protein